MWSSFKGPTSLPRRHILIYFLVLVLSVNNVLTGNEIWPIERPDGMPSIVSLEVMCGKDHMDIHLSFSHAFEGIVSSKGQHSDPRCIYVPPSTGKKFFSFRISYAKCGTKPDLNGQFYENTVVVQYDKDLLEVWDEAKRLRCEWFNDYEKTASKPPMVIADLDVIQLDFRGDNVDCWMEIQHGKGPWAPPVSGIVPLGSTLTLVVAINDYRGEFDMRVKSCIASDGAGHIIKLSDEYGCVLRPKMISRFLKARAPDERATVITYAFFHAFKFPDALSVHIKCKVEICRHGCLDHCQLNGNIHERKDTIVEKNKIPNHNDIDLLNDSHLNDDNDDDDDVIDNIGIHNNEPNVNDDDHDVFYDDIIHRGDDLAAIGGFGGNSLGLTQLLKESPQHLKQQNTQLPPTRPQAQTRPIATDIDDIETLFRNGGGAGSSASVDSKSDYMTNAKKDDKFPHGPRYLEAQNRLGKPAVAGPRSLNLDDTIETVTIDSHSVNRRSIRILDRKVRMADVGVSGIYDVISEADLAFSPDTKQEAVTVFQGRIQEEIVYGICMPVPGFSVLFILVTSAAIVSALVAGSLLYRYQLQKETIAHQNQTTDTANRIAAANTIGSWMTLRLFRTKHCTPVPPQVQQ